MAGVRSPTGGRLLARLWPLVSIQLLTGAGFSLCLPFLSLYLYGERGLPMSLVGTIMMGTAIVGALARAVGGELADRLGRRPVLLAALGARIFFFLGMAALVHFRGPIAAIAAAYLGVRFLGALAMPASSAMVADLAPEEVRMRAYGILRVGANLGWALGPSLGGYLKTFLPYSALFVLTAAVSATSLAIALLALHESFKVPSGGEPMGSILSTLRNRRFLHFVALSLLLMLVAGQLVSTLSVFTVERLGFSTAQFGALLTLNGLLVAVLQYPTARLMERRVGKLALPLGAALYGLGYLSMGWLRSFPGLMGAVGIATLGEIAFTPAAMTAVAELAPRVERGRYMGLYGLAESTGWSLGPTLGGVLLDLFPDDPRPLWGIVSSLALISSLGFALWRRGRP